MFSRWILNSRFGCLPLATLLFQFGEKIIIKRGTQKCFLKLCGFINTRHYVFPRKIHPMAHKHEQLASTLSSARRLRWFAGEEIIHSCIICDSFSAGISTSYIPKWTQFMCL